MFRCPVCHRPLAQNACMLCCERGHSFDLAAQGYVNLLLANQKSSPDPGDNAAMVHARTHFLDRGVYRPLSDLLNQRIEQSCSERSAILDAGCGEGYYADRLLHRLQAVGKAAELYGVDVSRRAVKHAAARNKEGHFAVASLFALPLADESVDVCYNVFSPICASEFSRVLRQEGSFFAVYPAPRHLYALKQVLYDHPYENGVKTYALEGFRILRRERLSYTFCLESPQLIQSLFMMTPYYYKTPAAGSERLSQLDSLEVEADFWLVAYVKERAA